MFTRSNNNGNKDGPSTSRSTKRLSSQSSNLTFFQLENRQKVQKLNDDTTARIEKLQSKNEELVKKITKIDGNLQEKVKKIETQFDGEISALKNQLRSHVKEHVKLYKLNNKLQSDLREVKKYSQDSDADMKRSLKDLKQYFEKEICKKTEDFSRRYDNKLNEHLSQEKNKQVKMTNELKECQKKTSAVINRLDSLEKANNKLIKKINEKPRNDPQTASNDAKVVSKPQESTTQISRVQFQTTSNKTGDVEILPLDSEATSVKLRNVGANNISLIGWLLSVNVDNVVTNIKFSNTTMVMAGSQLTVWSHGKCQSESPSEVDAHEEWNTGEKFSISLFNEGGNEVAKSVSVKVTETMADENNLSQRQLKTKKNK